MKQLLHISAYVCILILMAGCQEVIDIDLDKSPPALVVEGNIDDQSGFCKVRLSTTVNFDEPNKFPGIQGAVVTISDNVGNSATLTESAPGFYGSNALTPVPGRNYFLKVTRGGKEYTATSSMPATPVTIDAITVDSTTFGSTKFVYAQFTDPPGVKNFYRIIEIINGDTLSIINVTNDEFEDGEQILMPVFSDEDPKLESGDTVELILQCIDENVFNYYLQLIDVINNGSQSVAPANPTSNISNNALGYFSAHTVRSKTIVVP